MSWEYVEFHEQYNFRSAAEEILQKHSQGVAFTDIKKSFSEASQDSCGAPLIKAFVKDFEARLDTDETFKNSVKEYTDALKNESDGTQNPGFLKSLFQSLTGKTTPEDLESRAVTNFLLGFSPEKYGMKIQFRP